MKKIISVILCMLCLSIGIFAFTSCKPEEDPNEYLYGTYNLVGFRFQISGKSFTISVLEFDKIDTYWSLPEGAPEYILELKEIVGDAMTITEESVKFAGGNMEVEFPWRKSGNDIAVEETSDINFPFGPPNQTKIIDVFSSKNSDGTYHNYFEIRFSKKFGEDSCTIYFRYQNY